MVGRRARALWNVKRCLLLASFGEDADDLDVPLDPFDRICRMKLGPVLPGEGHIGEYVFFSGAHDLGELQPWRPCVGRSCRHAPEHCA